MKAIIASVVCFLAIVSASGAEEEKWPVETLVGNYEGRQVIDTEEWIMLQSDGTFTYVFIPLGSDGASYHGRWKVVTSTVVLIAPLTTEGEAEFSLGITREKGEIALVYPWVQGQNQNAHMLLPNTFVRTEKKTPNQRLEDSAGLPPPSSGKSTAVEHRLPGAPQR